MSPRSRASQYVAAGLVTAGGLFWATRDAWPWRRPLTAQPIVITDAYVEFTETLGRRETLSDVLARAGITGREDRKSTRLNSSHSQISYAVFCLKKTSMTSITNATLTVFQSCWIYSSVHHTCLS